jgi:hypothetical protein
MMSSARLTEPQQRFGEEQPMGDVLRVKVLRRGLTFDSRSDSQGSFAVTEVYCSGRESGKPIF